MGFGKSSFLHTFAALLVSLTFLQNESSGGPIIDWLCGRSSATPTYAQPIYSPYYTQPGIQQPAISYGNPCDPCGQVCQRATVGYAPQTYFRTTWVQVPVTNYRPIGLANSAAGVPTVSHSPCTTYLWQARRVPAYTTLRPLQTAFAAPFAGAAYAPANVAPGCASCGGTNFQAAAPYYSPAAPARTIGPSTTMPGPGISGSTISPAPSLGAPSISAPPYLAPGPMPSTPSGPVPADMQPSLAPGPSIRNFPPLDAPATPTPATPAPSAEPPRADPPLDAPAQAPAKPAREGGLRFVPDPDAPSEQPNRAPRLLSPREKTAAAPQREWPSTPIHWSRVRQANAEGAIEAPQTAAQSTSEAWDDTGWRPLRP